MKEYNPKTKKWETRTENVGDLKKKDLCKGRNPHDFVLVLPGYGVRMIDGGFANTEQIKQYYESCDRQFEYMKKEEEFLRSIGIEVGSWRSNKQTRYLMCSRCYRKEYERDKK